jgi:molecular chaperone DnaK (HSP70)
MRIHKFILKAFEGWSLDGYVPAPDGGPIESGVTIANGFDIGQRSVNQINDAFGARLADKLAPYAGISGKAAVSLIKSKPLRLSEAECEIIREYANSESDALLLADWERSTSTPFDSLTDEQQMVLTSLAYQYGDLPSRCPMAWKQATTGDWEALLRNLWNFKDAFESRRRQEYAVLLWGMCAKGEI